MAKNIRDFRLELQECNDEYLRILAVREYDISERVAYNKYFTKNDIIALILAEETMK